jgi:sugar/nucleoside kinase (ribokinase family)
MPLDLAQPCPAAVLIASRSDVGDLPPDLLWRLRAALDPALRHIVVTDGPGAVAVAGASGVQLLAPVGPAVAGDTIGAGDFFAAGLLQALAGAADIYAAAEAGQLAARRFLTARPAVLAQWRPDPLGF